MSLRARRPWRRFRPELVRLEDRLVPATFTVNTLADENDGVGVGGVSFREALAAANVNGTGADTIDFSVAGTIQLTGALPLIDSDLAVNGPGAANLTLRRDTGGNYRILLVGARDVTLSGLTLTNGLVNGNGGGIFNAGRLTVRECDLLGNTTTTAAVRGGGIFNAAAAELTVLDCTLAGNTATADGAISNAGTLTVVGTTIRDSSNFSVAGIGNGGTATVINCTFSNLQASNGAAAIHNSGGTLLVRNSTITNNRALGVNPSGGILNTTGATAELHNTLVAGNSGPGVLDNLNGTFSGSFNLIGGGHDGGFVDGVAGNRVGVADPLLAPLGDHGGRTLTHALLPGSLAHDAGSNAEALDQAGAALTTDQRGVPRLANGVVDIGAFEGRGFTLTLVGGDGQSATVGTAFASPLVVAVVANAAGEPVDGGLVTFTAPAGGASTSLALAPVPVSAGQASLITTANATAGSYSVVAAAVGAAPTIGFSLTNTPAVPVVTLTASDTTADENAGDAGTYTLARTLPADALTVRLDLGGTASTADYALSIPAGGALTVIDADTLDVTLSAGVGSVQLVLTPVNDAHAEADETLTLTALDQDAYDLRAPGGGTVTIGQNDFVVINTNESGEGTLAQAILNANALAGDDTITFAAAGTILLSGPLPIVTTALTLSGPGAANLTLQRVGGDSVSLLLVQSAGAVTVSGLTFRGNAETGRELVDVSQTDLTVTDCVFADNVAVRTGGIDQNGGDLTVVRSVFTNNTATGGGAAGGIGYDGNDGDTLTVLDSVFTGNTATGGGAGGAIATDGPASVSRSTFTHNDATGGGAGGAITGFEFVSVTDSLFAFNTAFGSAAGAVFLFRGGSMTNCTIHGNRSAWDSGGVLVGFDQTATITHCTITDNVGDEAGTGFGAGGGLGALDGATVTVTNSLIAGNFDTPDNAGPQTDPAAPHPDVSGAFLDGGGNLIGVVDGSTGFTVSTRVGTLAGPLDPRLAPLADNGGPTLTQALLPDSPALGAAVPSVVTTDQRGVARPQDMAGDSGAFELDNQVPTEILLAGDGVAENRPAGTSVGSFATVDPDAGDSHTYALVSGPGDGDNGSFLLDGAGNLTTAAAFDFEARSSYSIRVRSADAAGLAVEQVFAIRVSNVNEAPTASAGGPYAVAEGGQVVLGGTGSDPDAGDTLGFAWDLDNNGTFETPGATPTFSAAVLNGPGTYPVRLRVTDAGGLPAEGTATVTVTNVVPTAGLAGPSSGVRGQALAFTLSALDAAADQAAGFSYTVNWGDGQTQIVPRTPGNGSLTLQHVYGATGTWTVTVTATDQDNAVSAPVTRTLTTSALDVQPDPFDPTRDALIVGGTAGNDLIQLTLLGTTMTSQLEVRLNNVPLLRTVVTGSVIVYAGGGDDLVQAVATRGTFLHTVVGYGGTGHDTFSLTPSVVRNLVLGEEGNDQVFGGSGRDVLIGGAGLDRVEGNGGDDLLVGGSFRPTAGPAGVSLELRSVVQQWTGGADHATRVASLQAQLLAAVADDGQKDTLLGGAGTDLFVAALAGANADWHDLVTGQETGLAAP